jgi:hypothetical protein
MKDPIEIRNTVIKAMYSTMKISYSYGRIVTLLSVRFKMEESEIVNIIYDLHKEDIAKGFFV